MRKQVSLLLGWELLLFPISLLQVLGFALLVYGTFLFNNLVSPPSFLRPRPSSAPANAESATEPLLVAEEDEERREGLEETAVLPVGGVGHAAGFDVVPVKGHDE